MSKVYN